MPKRKELKEWGFIAMLFLPVIIMGKLRLHQSNLGLFLILSMVFVTIAMCSYIHFCRKWNLLDASESVDEQTDQAEAAVEKSRPED